jgi:hypothetical protein
MLDSAVATDRSTVSQVLFEEYLVQSHISYEPIETSPTEKRPDYRLWPRTTPTIAEVKEFQRKQQDDDPNLNGAQSKTSAAYNDLPSIRKKLRDAREQFSNFKDQPCVLVLYNPGYPRIDIAEPFTIFGAMYGDPGIKYRVSRTLQRAIPPITNAFLGNRVLLPNMNTTISAILVLEEFEQGHRRWRVEEQRQWKRMLPEDCKLTIAPNNPDVGTLLRIVRYDNQYASNPLPTDAFRGPADETWEKAAVSDRFHCVFTGSYADRLWARRMRKA